jgi:hypothetical protein
LRGGWGGGSGGGVVEGGVRVCKMKGVGRIRTPEQKTRMRFEFGHGDGMSWGLCALPVR